MRPTRGPPVVSSARQKSKAKRPASKPKVAKAPAKTPARSSKPKAKPLPKPGAKKAAPPARKPAPLAPKTATREKEPEPELNVPLPDGRRHVLSLSFVRDGDEFLARLESDAGHITEFKNRSLDQLLTLVAGELEDLVE